MNLDVQVKNRFNISEILKKILFRINRLENKTNSCSNSYSTDETLTGGTWIDGKPIYRRVVTGQAILDNLNIGFNYDIDNLITVEGYILLKHSPLDIRIEVRLPYIYNGDRIEFSRVGTIPYIYVQNGNNTFSESFQNTYTFIIEYTKIND